MAKRPKKASDRGDDPDERPLGPVFPEPDIAPRIADAKTPKQAVVLVHGIGEQRPLGTLREFVEAVYQRDLTLTKATSKYRTVDFRGQPINRTWIVPDDAAGSKELRRITTTDTVWQRRTDFYEFYWADITYGTPVDMVVDWLKGILFRSPFRVPMRTQVWIAWIMLWLMAAIVLYGAVALADPATSQFAGIVASIVGLIRAVHWWLTGLFGLGGIALLVYRLRSTEPMQLTKFGWPVALIVVALAVAVLAPLDVFANPRAWASVLVLAFSGLMTGLIAPYVGDIVRFVRATPGTIKSRQDIRERGLALLRALHRKGISDATDGTPEYDRIVVVGHSLGAMIAYDLIQRYWEEAGPQRGKMPAPDSETVAALNVVDGFVKDAAHGRPIDLEALQAAQGRLHVAMARESGSWLISDFVSLGSPIVHSEFLIADSASELTSLFEERMLSKCPPAPNVPGDSMLYRDAQGQEPVPHHAAVFSAVRWTNLYDDHPLPWLGDIVSGALPRVFGSGMKNVRLVIKRGGLKLLERCFTHTFYWNNARADWSETSDHIHALRDAIGLNGPEHEGAAKARTATIRAMPKAATYESMWTPPDEAGRPQRK